MLIEVKVNRLLHEQVLHPMAPRWGHMDGAPRGRGSAKEGNAAAAAIDAEVFAGVVPPPIQTQIQRMGGMSSAVIGGFCEHSPVVHELVAKFADITAKETAKEHG
jgi:hypothetical protein